MISDNLPTLTCLAEINLVPTVTFQRMREYMHGGTEESSARDRFMHGRFAMDRLDRHAVLFIYAHTRTRSARLNASTGFIDSLLNYGTTH